VDADFRIGRHGGGRRAALANDEFAGAEVKLFLLENGFEHQRPLHGDGGLGKGRSLRGRSDDFRSFDADARDGGEGGVAEGLDTWGHGWGRVISYQLSVA
jgi:hypothetical protein